MKGKINRMLAVFLTIVMLAAAIPFSGITVFAQQDYKVGDVIELGSYPQSEVKNSAVITALSKLSKTWVSYGYYSGEGDYGTMKPGDYMKYADVSYSGARYRAVTFTAYRSSWTTDELTANEKEADSKQDDYGYVVNTVYWFKYEPLKWRVLDVKSGLVMSETIIDAQAYSNTVYEGDEYYNDAANTKLANDYASSSIRKWLNNDFCNTAFSAAQKAELIVPGDKVLLLSSDDVCNSSYGFSAETKSSDTRKAKVSDYAKIQGVDVYGEEAAWSLCTAAKDTERICCVNSVGNSQATDYTYLANLGVRPAIRCKIQSPAPEQVTGLKASSASTAVKLSWTADSKATGYQVYKYNAVKKTYEFYKNITTNAITVSGLNSNSAVYFRVRAYARADGKNYFGDMSTAFRAITAPSKVIGLKASCGASYVKLSWAKAANVTGYRVYKYNASTKKWDSCALIKANVNSCTVSKLAAGMTYKFYVRAYRTISGSLYYSDISAVLTTSTCPSAPTVKGAAGHNSATLSWSKVTGASNYAVYMYDSATKAYKYIGRTAALQFTKTGLKANASYSFKVRACKVLGTVSFYSGYSNTVTVKAV